MLIKNIEVIVYCCWFCLYSILSVFEDYREEWICFFFIIIFWVTISFYPGSFYDWIIGKSLKFHNRKSLKFDSILQAFQTDFLTRLSFLLLKKGKTFEGKKLMKRVECLLIISIVHCFAKCFSSGIHSKVSRVFFCLFSFNILSFKEMILSPSHRINMNFIWSTRTEGRISVSFIRELYNHSIGIWKTSSQLPCLLTLVNSRVKIHLPVVVCW